MAIVYFKVTDWSVTVELIHI